jgi:hypothetical protein
VITVLGKQRVDNGWDGVLGRMQSEERKEASVVGIAAAAATAALMLLDATHRQATARCHLHFL